MSIPQRHRPLLASLVVFAALYAAAGWRYPGFLSLAVAGNLLSDNSFLGVIAVGMTFVILAGGIDLSVGAVMSASSIIVAVLIARGWPAYAAYAAALALGALFGAGQGALIHISGMRPFIVTLAGMFLARGLGFLLHLESLAIDDPLHNRIANLHLDPALRNWLPSAMLPLARSTTLLLLLVGLGGAYVSRFTAFGRAIYAIGGHEEGARLMGLNVGRVKTGVYAVSGFCAALGGVLLTLYLSSGSHIEGIGLELDAIAAVVIGGTLLSGGVGGVLGTLIGVLIIGAIYTIITTYAEVQFSSGMTKVAIGGLLLAFVVLQRALIGRRTA